MRSPVSIALESELKRLSKEEDIPMAELIDGIASSVGYSPRQIYNWRSVKWSIPCSVVPALCQRFKSTALVDALGAEVVSAEPVQDVDIREFAVAALREVCNHHSAILEAVGRGIDRQDLDAIEENAENVIRRERQLVQLAALEYERDSREKRRA